MTSAPLPVVVGSPRSGTTLLWRLLDAHRQLAMVPESRWIVELWTRLGHRGPLDVDRYVSDLVAGWPALAARGLDEDRIRTLLTDPPARDHPDAVRRLLADRAARTGKSNVGVKTPMFVGHLPLLAGWFPEARFIHLIRDGRDVVASMQAAPTMPDHPVDAAMQWRRAVTAGRRDGPVLGPQRYLEVRYEDLVRDPTSVLGTITAFLDLPFDDTMLTTDARELEDVVPDPQARRLHRRLLLAPTPGLRDWRDELDREALALVDVVAGDLCRELGYPPTGVRASTGQRLRAAVRAAVWPLRARLDIRRRLRLRRRTSRDE